MVSLNCAAIPDNLLESELFGHERGAFTGAHTNRPGALADAHRGTVLLDEIGDMDLISQAKILRAVETRSIQRLGSSRSIPVDVRLVAATHCDLSERVAQGRFRQDLYYRLQVARIHMPALRERPEDIGTLTQHHLEQLKRKYGGRDCALRSDLRRMFQAYQWPGNVRELKNLLESMFVFSNGTEFTPADLPVEYQHLTNGSEPAGERDRLLYVLRSTEWNKAEAARKLHCSRMTLYRKLAKYELLKDDAPDLKAVATPA
jgi:DNA-binding NtrC family response regulator